MRTADPPAAITTTTTMHCDFQFPQKHPVLTERVGEKITKQKTGKKLKEF
jgi:hypothetical protein